MSLKDGARAAVDEGATKMTTSHEPTLRHVLIVSHHRAWCAAVSDVLWARGVGARSVSSAQAVCAAVETARFDAALLDVRTLPAPAWFHALTTLAHASPAPAVVAWGDRLTSAEGFELGRWGARKLLPRRPRPAEVEAVIAAALQRPPAIEPHLRAYVGHDSLPRMVDRVRALFLDQALGVSRGARPGAAQILGVSRQALQQALRRRERAVEASPRRWPMVSVLRPRPAEEEGAPIAVAAELEG